MPATADFNDSDQEWHYALSWMAVDYIASTYGEGRMWELMDAMHNGGSGTRDADQDRVLDQVLGYGSLELAQRAAARIRPSTAEGRPTAPRAAQPESVSSRARTTHQRDRCGRGRRPSRSPCARRTPGRRRQAAHASTRGCVDHQ